jgi:hypothetical protein
MEGGTNTQMDGLNNSFSDFGSLKNVLWLEIIAVEKAILKLSKIQGDGGNYERTEN